MIPRIISNLYLLIHPWKAPTEALRRRRRDEREDTPIWSSRKYPPLQLDALNADVFRLIALEVRGRRGGLRALASCSSALRRLTSPVLFSRCNINLRSTDYPPERIRCYIRSITVFGHPGHLWLEGLLDVLPAVKRITFSLNFDGVSWEVLKSCFRNSRITSLTFEPSASFVDLEPYPLDDEVSITLSALQYLMTPWREQDYLNIIESTTTSLDEKFAHEAGCLKAIVPRMNDTATHLTLPMETFPVASMAALPWPKLQELTVYGRYLDPAQADTLPALLRCLTHLRVLDIRIFRREPLVRPPLLGRHNPPHCALSGLRSLTLAYPDPDDDIFAVDTTQVRHLSLRDSPRYYHGLAKNEWYSHDWAAPILTSGECLSVLRRMNLPQLRSLELVYLVEEQGFDDELLQYVAETYSGLSELELHRYRANRDEEVDYVHIVNLLSAAHSLRVARFNLDSHEDHGPYCDDFPARKTWRRRLTNELGWEIVKILEEQCPFLERVDMLYHGIPNTTWAEFHSSRSADPRFVLIENHHERWDSTCLPFEWYKISQFGDYESESEGSTPPPEESAAEHPQGADCTSHSTPLFPGG